MMGDKYAFVKSGVGRIMEVIGVFEPARIIISIGLQYIQQYRFHGIRRQDRTAIFSTVLAASKDGEQSQT
jgi:hypothetical protein